MLQYFKAAGLWVTTITVGLCFMLFKFSRSLSSVETSRAEVASSNISIGFFWSIALVIESLWAYPSDNPRAFSPIIVSKPLGKLHMNS